MQESTLLEPEAFLKKRAEMRASFLNNALESFNSYILQNWNDRSNLMFISARNIYNRIPQGDFSFSELRRSMDYIVTKYRELDWVIEIKDQESNDNACWILGLPGNPNDY